MNKISPINGTLMSMPCSQGRRIREAEHLMTVSKMMGRTMEDQLGQPNLWAGSPLHCEICDELRAIKEHCENLNNLVRKVQQ